MTGFEFIITAVIALGVGVPLVNMFDKWKKEMEKRDEAENE